MILMVANKHKESVALCIYHFPGVIGFWNCWFSRGKMGAGKEKKLLEERKRTNNRINSNITLSLRFKI